MESLTLTEIIELSEAAGLGNVLFLGFFWWMGRGIKAMLVGAGKFGGEALVVLGKLADKGVNIRLSVKLVDEDDQCITPGGWSRSGPSAHRPALRPTRSRDPDAPWRAATSRPPVPPTSPATPSGLQAVSA